MIATRDVLLGATLLLLAACGGGGGGNAPDQQGDGLQPGVPAPEFALTDVNPNSPTGGSLVSPSDYTGEATAWYFGLAT